MESLTLAVLLTCHNRKQLTLDCLASVFSQKKGERRVAQSVYLVDDGCTDGTPAAVAQAYPEVTLLPGDGTLMWNGGMRVAFKAAMERDCDYYLWLNDDTVLVPDAIARLIESHQQFREDLTSPAIVAGATQDPDTLETTYGGFVKKSGFHPMKLSLLHPTETLQPCETMSGNCVLVSRSVVRLVGNLDSVFVHSKGDWDYGYRLRQRGGRIYLAPGYVGTCKGHPRGINCWDDPDLSLKERLRTVVDMKNLPPAEWRVLLERHTNRLWPVYWLSPYVKLVWRHLYFRGKKTVKRGKRTDT